MGALNENEAYLLGLFVAGGKITGGSFSIRLPLGRWALNPARAAQFVRDLLNDVLPEFRLTFGIDCNFEIEHSGDLVIKPNGAVSPEQILSLKSLLQRYGLPVSGDLVTSADLLSLKSAIGSKKLLARRFLAGFFDVRASLEPSHRRHSEAAPIVSIEVPGRGNNFQLVVELCSWMTELGSTTDQVLWNHPSLHSGMNPTYKQWKKGFKIRVLAADFAEHHSFGMNVFSIGLKELVATQEKPNQTQCSEREAKFKRTSIHVDCCSRELPQPVRDKVFLHYLQVCAAMGCPFAPVGKLGRQMGNALDLVAFWPVLMKGTPIQIAREFLSSPDAKGLRLKFSQEKLAREYLGAGLEASYPKLREAMAYLLADNLKGKRPGPADAVIDSKGGLVTIRSYQSEASGGPLILVNAMNDRAALIGPSVSSPSQRTSGRVFIDGNQVRLRV